MLFDPPKRGANLILWTAGPAMLLLAIGLAAWAFRRRRSLPGDDRLSPEEQARLEALLKE